MLHQTLISPFFSFHLPSSSPANSPLPLPYSHSSRVEKETTMDLEMICSGSQLQEEEPYHIFGEEFVDEFLDLGGLTETEKELDDDDDKKKKETEEEEDNSVSSAVSFEPPPPVSELALPAHDDAELEWVSRLMDDSLLEFPPPCSATAVAVPVPPVDNKPAQEISSSAVVIRAKRSKRTRSPSGSWSNWGPADYSTSSSTTTTTTTTTTTSSSSSSTSYSSSSPLIFFTPILETSPAKKQKIPKKRGRKPKPRPPLAPSIPAAAGTEEAYYRHQPYPNSTAGMERRCSHCGVNKTPQWRAGPMGAKTLCNACGVRYKSGRLLPEYRPACSPTFVSHVHSNSHRKVLEMRRKKETIETPKEDDQSLYLVCSAPAVQSF